MLFALLPWYPQHFSTCTSQSLYAFESSVYDCSVGCLTSQLGGAALDPSRRFQPGSTMGSPGEFRAGGAKRDPTGTLHGSSCGRVTGSDIEIYAYQLEAAVAALTAFRMTRQIQMMTELMHQHISLLRHHCGTCNIGRISSCSSRDSGGCVPLSDFTPDSVPLLCPPPPSLHPTPVTVAAGTGAAAGAAHTTDKRASDYSWLFPSVGAESPLELGAPPPHRSLCKRAVNRGPLEVELRAAVAGDPGSLQWLHALSRIATDEQASQTILDIAAADPGGETYASSSASVPDSPISGATTGAGSPCHVWNGDLLLKSTCCVHCAVHSVGTQQLGLTSCDARASPQASQLEECSGRFSLLSAASL